MKSMSASKGRDLRTVFLIALFLLFNANAFSQDPTFAFRVDSLKSALTGSEGKIKQNILYKLAYEHLRINDTIALPYSAKAYKMAWQFDDSLMIVKSGRIRAQIFKELDEIDSSIV